MNDEALQHMPHRIFDAETEFHTQAHDYDDILAEIKRLECKNNIVDRVEGVDDLLRHLNKPDEELLKSLTTEIKVDAEDFDLLKYADSELFEDEVANLLNTDDLSIERPKSSLRGTEIHAKEALVLPEQPLHTLQWQLQRKEVKLLQDEHKSTMNKDIYSRDTLSGTSTQRHGVPYSCSFTYNWKNPSFADENMQPGRYSRNEGDTVLHSEPLRKIVFSAQRQNQILKPTYVIPVATNSRNFSEKLKNSSQVSGNNRMTENEMKYHCYNGKERNKVVDAADTDTGTKKNFNKLGNISRDSMTKNIQVDNNKRRKISILSLEGIPRPHMCNVCKKSFRDMRSLSQHLKIHYAEKPHLCNVCNKSFRAKCDLTRHLTTHSDERPHLCNVCNKSFRHTANLWMHLKTHSDEKPYKCNVCNKSFLHNNSLSQHLSRNHSGEMSYVCKVCNKSFRQKYYLNNHFKKCHSAD